MSRYRKIEVRMWGDEKFRALSPLLPSGQGLWLFLLTGPHTGPIPGLFSAGRAGLAENLKWTVEAFDQAFGEALAQGMAKADWDARVVWIPNGIQHNKPESPNVVLSWGDQFDLIPECDLKREACESLKSSVHALGEGYREAFNKAFEKASRKPSGKPSPKPMPNQEQEQEQETKTAAPDNGARQSLSLLDPLHAQPAHPTIPKRRNTKAPLKTQLPEHFGISERVKKWAGERGHSRLQERLEDFVGYCRAKGAVYADWDAAFMNAIREDWAQLNGKNGVPKTPTMVGNDALKYQRELLER
jgi:hypothetical protein